MSTVPMSPSAMPAPGRTRVDGVQVLGALSPSRAGDFVSCPLLFRFRTIDRLPEPTSPEALRGTLVHQVLEDIFELPASSRTPDQAQRLLLPAWEGLLETSEQAADLVRAGLDVEPWLASAREILDRWFELEDPTRLEPAEREVYVECLLDSGLLMRGVVDRLDITAEGAIRVVDYKGLALDTPLPTPAGWTTMGAVEVGDKLLGTDGRSTTVLNKSGIHHRPCYRVSFRDGSTVVCDNVHLWTAVSSYRQALTKHTLDTDALAALHAQLKQQGRPDSLWVEVADPLKIEAPRELPVDPWLLGAWLGDGSTRGGELTVGEIDLVDMLAIVKERWLGDVRVARDHTAYRIGLLRRRDRCTYGHGEWTPPTPGHSTRRCRHESEHFGSASNVSFSTVLNRAGVRGNKHIPDAYLRASTQQRIELLRGLMDTDGWWNRVRHRAGFTTTSDGLGTAVVELLRTLGVHPCHFTKPYLNATRPGRNWHVIEFTPTWFNPFSLPRKALLAGEGVTDIQRMLAKRRIIASVEPVDSVPTQCVEVDAADSLYLCGRGFVPTHNTGPSPAAGFEARALFQLRFYAFVLWRTRGVVPSMLQLVYLGDGQIVRYEPDEADLLATERKVQAIWAAIREAERTGNWEPSPGRNCDWCPHHALCPVFGGTPPPLPVAQGRDSVPPDDTRSRLRAWLRRLLRRS